MEFKTISEASRIDNNLNNLDVYQRGAFYLCYTNAIGKDGAFSFEDLEECFFELPLSILGDILSMSIHNEVVQAKITDWMRDVYLKDK